MCLGFQPPSPQSGRSRGTDQRRLHGAQGPSDTHKSGAKKGEQQRGNINGEMILSVRKKEWSSRCE